jgi:hypothetical protein
MGVELMDNWDVHLQGSAETSHGGEFIAEGGSANARAFPLRITPYTSFLVVATPGYARVYDAAGLVEQGNIMLDAYFRFGTKEWVAHTTGSGYVSSVYGAVTIVREGTGYARIYQDYSIKGSTTGTYRVKVRISEIEGVGQIAIGNSSGAINLHTEFFSHVGTIEFDLDIVDESTLSLTVQAIGESSLTVTSVQMFDVDSGLGNAEFVTPWDAASFDTMQYVADPLIGADDAFASQILIACRNTELIYIKYSERLFGCEAGIQILTNQPSVWGADDRPNAIEFYGGRLWLGGCVSAPNTFWASTTTDTYDFNLGTGLDDEAISADIDGGGLIEWIKGAQGRGLVMGTDKAEHSIYASGGVLIPGDTATALQSSYGATTAPALELGDKLSFITTDNRKIRATEYDYDTDVWKSRDLTYPSDHITKGGGRIKRMSYAANPNSRIIGVTRDGRLIQATYDIYTEAIGFSTRSTNGRIVDAISLPFDGSDEIWMVVDRGVDAPLFCIERMRQSRNTKMDSHVIFNAEVDSSGTPTKISGGTAEHLADRTCQVLVDGAVHPDVTLDSSGNFTVEVESQEIIIGLQLTSTILTLPVADEQYGSGTTRTMMKRMTSIWAKLIDSWRPKINGYRAPDQFVSTLMDTAEASKTENLKITNLGYDMEAKVLIEQDLPLPTEIGGWFSRLTQEEV